jgi:hypothetical protein
MARRIKPRNAAEAYANRRHSVVWSVIIFVIIMAALIHMAAH